MTEKMNSPVIKENINGNVLFSMQNIHFSMFNNKREETLSNKSMTYSNNFKIKHKFSPGNITSKGIFRRIEETTNYLLERNGLGEYKITDRNRNYTAMEFRQTNCFSSNPDSSISHFDIHTDDYGPLNSKCISIIFYVRKDRGIKGGNFLYKKDKNFPMVFSEEIAEGDVVIFKGNLEHAQEPTYGIGCRDTIGVFIPI
jgi:hypothetical protein